MVRHAHTVSCDHCNERSDFVPCWKNNLRELMELAIMFNKESASITVQRNKEKVLLLDHCEGVGE